MSPKKKEGFDDIFAPTADAPAEPKKRGNGRKAEPAPEPAPAPASAPASASAPMLSVDLGAVLQTAWSNHEREALYRKAKEDRLLFSGLALLAALVFGAAALLSAGRALDWNWIAKLVFRGASAAFVLALTFALTSMIELNRKRLQDVLAMIVKIQENLRLFDDGAIPGLDGAFLPNTYKFVGSMNDDETNHAQMILKIAAGAVIATILLLV